MCTFRLRVYSLGLEVLVLGDRESGRLRGKHDQDRLSTLSRKSIPCVGLRAKPEACAENVLNTKQIVSHQVGLFPVNKL